MTRPQRPVYLNLLEFRFPATAIASLLHRISGALLFLALPLLIYGLELSLQGEPGRAALAHACAGWPPRLGLVLMGWALLHHWLAGWRFLLLDIEVGVRIDRARLSARLLNVASLFGLWLLGVMLL